MPEAVRAKPSLAFWAVSVALLLWGLLSQWIWVDFFRLSPEQYAEMVETPEYRQSYAKDLAAIPSWSIALAIAAAFTRLVGAIALLLRRAVAFPLYLVSTVLFLVVIYRGFVLADAGTAMSPGHIGVEAAFVALSLFAAWFAYRNRSVGILR
jgi:hypothetical protein